MLEHYLITALTSRKYHANRPTLQFSAMSDNFALSDVKTYAQHHVRKPPSAHSSAPSAHKDSQSDASSAVAIGVPNLVAGSGSLDRLVDTACDYARQATAENTTKAYAKDWAHFTSWCRRRGANALPPSPELIGLYIANCAAPDTKAPALSVSTIERRLSGLAWHYQQRGFALDRKDRHIATLPFDLRGLRDRAILLIGYAGGLRRSEIVSLDHGKDDTPDSGGWVQIEDDGALLFLRGKTGWREVEIGRGSSDQTCPVHALEQWLHFAKINFGPLFRRTTRDNRRALEARLSDKHVVRLIKQTVLNAGIRSELSEKDRLALFSGHSLRAGLASSAEVDERYIQKQLGHASAEMTRRYQRRRDRFRVNLTKAAGL